MSFWLPSIELSALAVVYFVNVLIWLWVFGESPPFLKSQGTNSDEDDTIDELIPNLNAWKLISKFTKQKLVI